MKHEFFNIKLTILILSCSLFFNYSSFSQSSEKEGFLQSPKSVVSELYNLVTFEAGIPPNWEKVKSLFIDEAVIVLRTGRDSTTQFTVNTFVKDFINFIEQADVIQTGFAEKIIRMEKIVFGDIAHFLVLYEASIPSSSRPPMQGVDSFQLIKKDGRWWIVSVINEIPTTDNPVPIILSR